MDETFGDLHLYGHNACSAPQMGQTESTEITEFMTSQSPGIKRYIPIHKPGVHQS